MNTGDKARILLVDDSRTVRQLLKLVLQKHLECAVEEAADGQEALGCLRESSFNLVITDINMPGMDGLGLIRAIRDEMGQKPPIIVVTTMGREVDRDAGLKLGADSYVTKPINAGHLVKTACALLG